MKLHHGVIAGVALLQSLPLPVHGFDTSLTKVLNLAYGATGGPMINYSMSSILANITQLNPSAISNFMLNVGSHGIPLYQPLLNNIVNMSIPIYPAIGDPNLNYTINDPFFRNISMGYANFTKRIQIDGLQTYINRSTADVTAMYAMINWLPTIGFTDIQLNPWPLYPNHTVYNFSDTAVSSAMEQVIVAYTDANHTTYDPTDPTNWQINTIKINAILNMNSTTRVIINYENAPAEVLLSTLNKTTQLAAFNATINNITATPNIAGRVHWTAPWSQNYDPFLQGTWPNFLAQFAKGNPP